MEIEDIARDMWEQHGRGEALSWGELTVGIREVWRRRALVREDIRRQLEPAELTIEALRRELSALRADRDAAVRDLASAKALLVECARFIGKHSADNEAGAALLARIDALLTPTPTPQPESPAK
jgi:hypothetical protein